MSDAERPEWKSKSNSRFSAQPSMPVFNSPTVKPISWTASEYVSHDKSTTWFVQFGLVVLLISGAIYVFTRDLMSVFYITIFGIGFGIFAGRKPQVLQYTLDSRGVHIGNKSYPISMFKSFAVVEEEGIHSIQLMPMKRFMPSISVYFAPDDEQEIMQSLSSMLPLEQRKQDSIDRLMHRIRF